ncbi:Myosin-2 [Rhizoctonia solani]|uniref:Myosin-2 n=1 Tax=Rhizoctonia solani TaxID=456999 RepID=A0A0K6FMC7_9AGAM|nr:Myosin-2 [Rhizoctonia solani]
MPGDYHSGTAYGSSTRSQSGGGKSFPIVMLVMGLSGSGKSSLINRATGQTDFSRINDCELRFIDTPGFGNDMIDDRKVIEQLVEYFATPIVRHDGANLPRRLTGLLYIHSEDGSFKGRTSRKTIEFLVKVLGEQFLDRVTVLVQTQNEAPSDLAKTTQSRESPLYPLYRHNTKPWATVPYPQDLQSIERILESYITLQERLVRPAVADKFFSSRASNNWQYDNISRHLKEMFPDDVGQVAIADQAEVQLEAPPPERTDELEKAHTLIAKKEQELKDLQSTHENELKSLQEQNKAQKSNLELQLSSLCQTIRDREVEISKFQSRQGPELEETGALKEVSSKKDSEIQLLRAGLEAKDEELTKIKEDNERAIRESMEKLQAKEREITELKSRNPGTINKTTNSKRQGDEIEYLKAELRRIDAEYGSLRTHMQLEENTSQADIMTALGDINRLTEEFGQTISEHVEKHMEDNPPEKAFQPKDLLCIFGQVKSNVASKIKLDAYLFLEYVVQAVICDQLYTHLFKPFHPNVSDDRDLFIVEIHRQMARQGPQTVSGRWRRDAFNAISKSPALGNQDQPNSERMHALINKALVALLEKFDGIQPEHVLKEHHQALAKLITKAEGLNQLLKGEVSVLGDFQPVAFPFNQAFQSSHMTEVTSKPKKPVHPDTILGTLGLGLIMNHASGGGQEPEETVLHRATVFGLPK